MMTKIYTTHRVALHPVAKIKGKIVSDQLIKNSLAGFKGGLLFGAV
jgi:hypothetical protein